ncbi:MAG: DUF1223 domain-containing protein [Alphaproteobacteria bacterium]|nr:DUF1223 domain-containing protein [Alphaproteobacteria bacterium]
MLNASEIRRGFVRAFAGLLLGLGISAAPAAAGEPVTVVELFTSQGCPSCPSADAFLGELADRDDVLALSLHVDHWNFMGWQDPFASELFSARQQRYLNQHGLPYVYTPQIVVDGVFQASGNKPLTVLAGIEQARATSDERFEIQLDRISDTQVRVRIPDVPARYRGEAELVLVRFDDKHVTEVTKGENRGRTIVNHHVVRLMRPVARWNGAPVDVVVSLQDIAGAAPAYCAVFLQERGQRRILGAAMVDMRGS